MHKSCSSPSVAYHKKWNCLPPSCNVQVQNVKRHSWYPFSSLTRFNNQIMWFFKNIIFHISFSDQKKKLSLRLLAYSKAVSYPLKKRNDLLMYLPIAILILSVYFTWNRQSDFFFFTMKFWSFHCPTRIFQQLLLVLMVTSRIAENFTKVITSVIITHHLTPHFCPYHPPRSWHSMTQQSYEAASPT